MTQAESKPLEAKQRASIGVAIDPEHGANATALAGNADFAMCRAKQNGRNKVQAFTADLADP